MSTLSLLAMFAGASIGAFVSGAAGFAFGLVALSFWAWFFDPLFLSPMVVFSSIITQSMAFAVARRGLDWPKLVPILIGGVLGVPVGVLLLNVVDVRLFKIFVGALLVVYTSYLLLAASVPKVRRGGRFADGVVGLASGVMGGLAGLSGPALVSWCTLRGWGKEAQRGVFQAFFMTTHVMTFTGYALSGKLTWPVLRVLGMIAPAVLIFAWIGAKVCERISERQFKLVVLLLLLFSGLALLVGALAKP